MQETHKQFNSRCFTDLQYACKRNGIELICHKTNFIASHRPDLDIFSADGENAFNLANRITGLETIKDRFPAALPHLRNMYLNNSTNAWYYGKPDCIDSIDCVNGYHQGDVLASWAYCMTIQPLLEHIQDTIEKEFPDDHSLTCIQFYVDDGNFIAPHHIMLRIIDILKSHETYMKYGFKLKPNKGFYLHISTGCPKDAHRLRTHDALKVELDQILRYAGFWTTREETQSFGVDLPDDNHRPDISIRNPEGLEMEGSKVLVDVAVTCPVRNEKCQVMIKTEAAAAKSKGKQAEEMYKIKMNKYDDLKKQAALQTPNFQPNSIGIVPFIFESTGLIHKNSLEFLERVADQAAEMMRMKGENLGTYFLKRLSICLQKHLALAINLKIMKLMGHTDFRNDRNFNDAVIMEDGIV